MFLSFKNILVPVDFSINTEVAVNKAIELIDDGEAIIHLLYVNKNYSFKKEEHSDHEKKLKEWKESIEYDYPNIIAKISVVQSSSIQNAIQRNAREINADLIVIGQSSMHSWLPLLKTVLPMRLAASTAIAVLTVKPGAL